MQAHSQTVTKAGAADRVACSCFRQCLPNSASHNNGKYSKLPNNFQATFQIQIPGYESRKNSAAAKDVSLTHVYIGQ